MYRLGHRIKKHYRIYIVLSLVVVVLIVLGVILLPKVLRSTTTLKQSKGITSYISFNSASPQLIIEPDFRIDIPAGWKAAADPGTPYQEYSWQGTGTDINRRIDVYINNVPTSLAVNRLLPVSVSGDQINVVGTVSDNCANFTPSSAENVATGTAPAKWQGVSFICDMANYERNVVTIGSGQGVNDITLSGPKTGSHQVLIAYTDNSYQPDYSIFEDAIASFRVL